MMMLQWNIVIMNASPEPTLCFSGLNFCIFCRVVLQPRASAVFMMREIALAREFASTYMHYVKWKSVQEKPVKYLIAKIKNVNNASVPPVRVHLSGWLITQFVFLDTLVLESWVFNKRQKELSWTNWEGVTEQVSGMQVICYVITLITTLQVWGADHQENKYKTS